MKEIETIQNEIELAVKTNKSVRESGQIMTGWHPVPQIAGKKRTKSL